MILQKKNQADFDFFLKSTITVLSYFYFNIYYKFCNKISIFVYLLSQHFIGEIRREMLEDVQNKLMNLINSTEGKVDK